MNNLNEIDDNIIVNMTQYNQENIISNNDFINNICKTISMNNLNEIDDNIIVNMTQYNQENIISNNDFINNKDEIEIVDDILNERIIEKNSHIVSNKNKRNCISYNVCYSFIIFCLLLAYVGIFMFFAYIDIYMIIACKHETTYDVIDANIINMKIHNNNPYVIFDYEFKYNNNIGNMTQVCPYDDNDCIKKYNNYIIGQNITLYFQDKLFKFETSTGICIGTIFIIPVTIIMCLCFMEPSIFLFANYCGYKKNSYD